MERGIDKEQGGIIALVVSFVLEMRELTEGFMFKFFLYYYHGGTE